MRKFFGILIVMALCVSVGLVFTNAQSDGDAQIRFVHVIPGVAAVDIYVDGQLTVSNLGYGEASGYINVPSGNNQVTVRPGGISTVLWEQSVNADAETPQLLVASSIDPLEFVVYDDDLAPISLGTTRFKAIHAIQGGEALDVTVAGEPVADGWEYLGLVGTFDIPADTYELAVFPSGGSADDALVPEIDFNMVTNTSEVLILYGTASIPEVLELSTPLQAEGDAGLVRVGHGVADAPAVDIYASGLLIVPGLEFGETTEHLALPPGDIELEVRIAGTTSSVITASLTVEADTASTVLALGSAQSPELSIFADDVSSVADDSAVVSVINTIPGGDSSVTATLADGTVLAEEIAFGEASEPVVLDPVSQNVTLTLTLDGQTASIDAGEQSFYGGVYYNALALNGTAFQPPSLAFFPTGLAQSPGSAPGAEDVAVVQAPPVVTEEAVEAVPTEPPVATPDTEISTPDPADVVAVTEIPTVLPPVLAGDELPPAQGRIIVDPGVNLQLRQFPDANALSLGLAPSGTVLAVNGREGAPVDLDGNVVQIEDENGVLTDWVDPVTLLDPEVPTADLDPASTWLNITFATPDGGEIEAWVLATYLNVTETETGEPQLLRELETVPQNRFGRAVDTQITSPDARENRVTARVIGIDAGANLNIRRTADTSSEILARVPAGTVMDLAGIGASGEWAFVELTTAQGSTISGWVTTRYLQYQLNGENTTLEILTVRDLLDDVDEANDRGEVGGSAPALVQPTVNPLINAFVSQVVLNEGVNLNLRRTPDTQAEVVARIPNGTSLIISGRTEDNAWFQTSFEGITGWVASDFLTQVTFNGTPSDPADIPVIDIESEPLDAEEDAAEATEEPTTG